MRVWLYNNIQSAYNCKKICRQRIQLSQSRIEEYTKLLRQLKAGDEMQVSERIEEICRKAVSNLQNFE